MYSQKGEDKIIWDYFKDKPTSNLLDVGANDGKTFSNSRYLIDNGWGGVLVEPSPKAFDLLFKELGDNPSLYFYPIALTDHNGKCTFYESGFVKINGRKRNIGLGSTLHKKVMDLWGKHLEFEEITVRCSTFEKFMTLCPIKKFHFISIDIEGEDWNLLQQMNLDELGCEMLCIEHNNGNDKDKIIKYCEEFGLKKIAETKVNLILAK